MKPSVVGIVDARRIQNVRKLSFIMTHGGQIFKRRAAADCKSQNFTAKR